MHPQVIMMTQLVDAFYEYINKAIIDHSGTYTGWPPKTERSTSQNIVTTLLCMSIG